MEIDFTKTKYEKPVSQVKKSLDSFKTIMVLIFIVILVVSGYFFYQEYSLRQANKKLETSITSISETIKSLTNTDNPTQKILVAKNLNKLKKSRIKWSEIMAKIIQLETPGINFRDFAVTPTGEVKATVLTNSFEGLSKFILKLNDNSEISNIVIESISNDTKENALFSGLDVDLNFKIKK